jgi:cyclic pyranopterin phosphate synthase
MPTDEYALAGHREILTDDEIARLVRIFAGLGVRKVRLTGGEPLMRPRLDRLVSRLSGIDNIEDLCLTTNGSLLASQAGQLAACGLSRVNVSLDTLDPRKYRIMSRHGELDAVLAGIDAALECGLTPVKINVVVQKGVNDDEILTLAEFGRARGVTVRFIEFMDVGQSIQWHPSRMMAASEIREKIDRRYPIASRDSERGSSAAELYAYADGNGEVGFIAGVTDPFCDSCTRLRVTSDGALVPCLFSRKWYDLRGLLRGGTQDAEIAQVIKDVWHNRKARHGDQAGDNSQSPGAHPTALLKKIEMIRLGG